VVRFLRKVDVKEIHGYRPELGLRVFRPEVLAALEAAP
jgi:arginine decarboxylase